MLAAIAILVTTLSLRPNLDVLWLEAEGGRRAQDKVDAEHRLQGGTNDDDDNNNT
jgi:hypothetical protein